MVRYLDKMTTRNVRPNEIEALDPSPLDELKSGISAGFQQVADELKEI